MDVPRLVVIVHYSDEPLTSEQLRDLVLTSQLDAGARDLLVFLDRDLVVLMPPSEFLTDEQDAAFYSLIRNAAFVERCNNDTLLAGLSEAVALGLVLAGDPNTLVYTVPPIPASTRRGLLNLQITCFVCLGRWRNWPPGFFAPGCCNSAQLLFRRFPAIPIILV
jgi:hypothetical protein